MNNTFTRALVAVALLTAFQAHAWTTSKDAADRLGADQVKEISFDKNMSNLTDEQKNEIRTAVNEAAQKGKIEEVKILAWSDKEYPAEKGKQSKDDVNLAKNRIRDLKAFLKDDLKVSSVDTYNMTERPNALQKFFHTSEAKVKKVAEASGAAPTEGNTGLFDMKAQASKGVVMIFMKK
jgi:hypothetical protein